jgi:arabinofuranosyltransferase
MPARALRLGLYVIAAVFGAIASWHFAAFTADDAYIVARYAVNARDIGEWAFNPGEPVSALTSPLHGLLLIGLSFFAADPLPLYKVFALLIVVAASMFLLVSYGVERREAMPLAAVLVAPSVILWTFAGLETPLLAAIVTAMAAIYTLIDPGNGRRLPALGALAGFAVLTRYDAVLFAGPVLVAGLVHATPSWKERMIAVTLAGIPPSIWLMYAWLHYGSVLPTSFYIKTPTAALDVMTVNLRYMAEHLLIGGVGVMAVYAIFCLISRREMRTTLGDEMRAHWGLHAGVAAVLAYGATMATVHMMFAFRHFVPYFGATALALAHVARRADAKMGVGCDFREMQTKFAPDPHFRARSYAAGAAALLILLIHAFHAEAMYRRSLQGLGTFGEYGEQGVAGYARDYIPAMMKNAADVKAHWSTLNKGRQPRVWTFAAGALPYAYREAYIFEALVSFRHGCPAEEDGRRSDGRVWRAHADYIHAFTRHGRLARLLAPVRARDVTLISEQPIHFNGRDEKLLVYYNPAPFPNVLPPRIDAPCLPAFVALCF